MDKNLLETKLAQLVYILEETERWLAVTPEEFSKDTKLVRACQRNLQLLVEYGSDINGLLVLELGNKVPGSYRESFSAVFGMDVGAAVSEADRRALLDSAEWRNNLIHEYDPEESDEEFYSQLKLFLGAYRAYAKIMSGISG